MKQSLKKVKSLTQITHAVCCEAGIQIQAVLLQNPWSWPLGEIIVVQSTKFQNRSQTYSRENECHEVLEVQIRERFIRRKQLS
jgi:hypothetical protein